MERQRSSEEIAAQFRECRQRVWRRVKPSIFVALTAFALVAVSCPTGALADTLDVPICAIALVFLFGAAMDVTIVCETRYRCPNCKAPVIPLVSLRSPLTIDLNPETCRSCERRLR